MGAKIDIEVLQRLAEQAALDGSNGSTGGRRLLLTNPANVNPQWDAMLAKTASLSMDMWSGKPSQTMRSDAQIVTTSQCALTSMLAGFYEKQPLEKPWANGEYITITDAGTTAGTRVLEWERQGDRHTPVDDDIMAPDDSPQRAIGEAVDVQSAKRAIIKNKVQLNWFELEEAALRGYDKFEAKGRRLRRRHMFNIDNVVRRGNVNNGQRGIVNYPGVRRRVAAVDWGTANADVIYDDYNSGLNQVYASPTEEALPELGILPRLQFRHFETEQFSPGGTDTTLLNYLIRNNRRHNIVEDPGLATAGPNDQPVAIFMTPRRDLVWVTAPMFAQVQQPYQVNTATVEIEIWTVLYGVQVNDEDTILVIDGEGAGWGRYGDGT